MDRPLHARVERAQNAAARLRKLSAARAEELRRDHESGLPYSELSVKYGIAKCAISYIINRKTYK